MAIIKDSELAKNSNNVPEIKITIENGDLEALKKIVTSYSFKDETSALRFALAILLKADGNKISIDDEIVGPNKSLLKDDANTHDK